MRGGALSYAILRGIGSILCRGALSYAVGALSYAVVFRHLFEKYVKWYDQFIWSRFRGSRASQGHVGPSGGRCGAKPKSQNEPPKSALALFTRCRFTTDPKHL